MSIKAKKSTIIRIIGTILIFIGLCSSTLFNIQVIKNFIGNFIWISLIFPWIISFILLKLSNDFISKHIKIILYLLVIYSILIIFIVIIWNLLIATLIIFNFCLSLLLLNCWSLSLSIYKKKKIIFLINGISYISGAIIFNLQLIFLTTLISIITVGLGVAIILITEYNMYKKGYLNYI